MNIGFFATCTCIKLNINVQKKIDVNNVDKSSLWAPWQCIQTESK